MIDHRSLACRTGVNFLHTTLSSCEIKANLSCVHNCHDLSLYLQIIRRSSDIWTFIYSLVFFIFYRYITNSERGQLTVGLIAQLAEHCTGIAEVLGSNPVQAWSFLLGFNFTTAKVVYITAMITHIFRSFSAVQIHELPYIHLYSVQLLTSDQGTIHIKRKTPFGIEHF